VGYDPDYKPRFSLHADLHGGCIPKNFGLLKTLDIQFESTSQLRESAHYLTWKGPAESNSILQKLRISVSGQPKHSEIFTKAVTDRHVPQERRLVNVKQLTLQGFNLSNLFTSVSLMVDVQALTHLTLWKCDAAHLFMQELVGTFGATKLELEHLAVRLDEKTPENVDGCLEGLFGICSLTSLHLTWDGVSNGRPATTLANISHLAPSLRSLSFHDGSVDAIDHDVEYLGTHFGESLGACDELQQLGLQVNDQWVDPAVWDCRTFNKNAWGHLYPQGQFWVRYEISRVLFSDNPLERATSSAQTDDFTSPTVFHVSSNARTPACERPVLVCRKIC
jgi:hypothetical protein